MMMISKGSSHGILKHRQDQQIVLMMIFMGTQTLVADTPNFSALHKQFYRSGQEQGHGAA